MKFYSILKIGCFHTNNCEDFLINEPISSNERVIAVFDGCTMGKESVFSSILHGKVLRKIAKEMFYLDFFKSNEAELRLKLKEVVKALFNEIRFLKNQLGLNTNELLSTLLLGIINTQEYKSELLTIGDGLICHDGKLIEFEQGNTPDYLAYHLSKPFESWYKSQKQFYSIDRFEDLSISTDGIFTFKNLSNKEKQKDENDIINYLLVDSQYEEYENNLHRKVRFLEENLNHSVTDDLAIIRVRT